MFDQREYGQGGRPDFLGKYTTSSNRNDCYTILSIHEYSFKISLKAFHHPQSFV